MCDDNKRKTIKDVIFVYGSKKWVLFWGGFFLWTICICTGLINSNIGVSIIIMLISGYAFYKSGGAFNIDIGDVLIFAGMSAHYYIVTGEIINALSHGIAIWQVYEIGKLITGKKSNSTENEKRYEIVIILIATLFFIRGVLNYCVLFTTPGALEREVWGTFASNSLIPRTQHEFYFIMMSSLFPVGVLLLKQKKRFGLVIIMMSIVGDSLTIYSHGRMNTISSIATVCALLFWAVIGNWKDVNKKKLYLFILSFIGVIICWTILFYDNAFGLQDWYYQSMWSGSGGLFTNTRLKLQLDTIKMIPKYPMGKCDVPLIEYNGTKTMYAHNSWLDIARGSGVIPFTLVLIFTLMIIKDIFDLWGSERSTLIGKSIVTCAFTGIFLYNLAEPAICSDLVFWAMLIFTSGIIRGNVNKKNESCKEGKI